MSTLRADFIGRCQLKGFSERTITTYVHAVAALSRFHKRSPLELSHNDIRKFCLHEINVKKYAPRTVNMQIGALRTFYNLMKPGCTVMNIINFTISDESTMFTITGLIPKFIMVTPLGDHHQKVLTI